MLLDGTVSGSWLSDLVVLVKVAVTCRTEWHSRSHVAARSKLMIFFSSDNVEHLLND